MRHQVPHLALQPQHIVRQVHIVTQVLDMCSSNIVLQASHSQHRCNSLLPPRPPPVPCRWSAAAIDAASAGNHTSCAHLHVVAQRSRAQTAQVQRGQCGKRLQLLADGVHVGLMHVDGQPPQLGQGRQGPQAACRAVGGHHLGVP